ncbi:MAG: anthranilate phosphoribosyltransferase, partial [Pseudobdellovibrionaceae bacterium]
MKWALEKIFSGAYLSADEAEKVMDQILQEDLPAEQVAAFLGALQARQENETEVLGFVQSLRKKSEVFSTAGVKALDVCGTGGDASGSFNISTAVALLLAASDIPVVKHGNRAVSSRSGSADVLQALNLPWDLSKPQAEKCFAETGFVFLLAPLYHPVLSKVRTLRQNIGVKTIFNLLG